MITTEIKKKGKKEHTIVDLDIVQKDKMGIEILKGPVFWKGKDYSIDEAINFVIEKSSVAKGVWVYLVLNSDGKRVILIDEIEKGELKYKFFASSHYLFMYKIGVIEIPANSNSLDNATLSLYRWFDERVVEREEEGN